MCLVILLNFTAIYEKFPTVARLKVYLICTNASHLLKHMDILFLFDQIRQWKSYFLVSTINHILEKQTNNHNH